MTKYIDAEKLRKEVKRLEKAAHKSALGCADSETRKFHEGKDYAYQHVGILIGSLQPEQQEEPDKSLEEAADTYKNSYSDPNGALARASKRAFIAGWKCRDNQMPMPEDTVLFQKGVAEGRRLEREDMMKDGNVILAEEDFDAEKEKSMEWGYNLCKEQMLKDAVEGFIFQSEDYYPKELIARYDGELKHGDKVRIVVLKAEEEEV